MTVNDCEKWNGRSADRLSGFGRASATFALAVGMLFAQVAGAQAATPLDVSVTRISIAGYPPYMAGTTMGFTVIVHNGSGNVALDRGAYRVTLRVSRPNAAPALIEARPIDCPGMGYNESADVFFGNVALGDAVGEVQVNAVIFFTNAQYEDTNPRNDQLAQPIRMPLTSLDADLHVLAVRVRGNPPYVAGSRRSIDVTLVNDGPGVAKNTRVSLVGGTPGALQQIGGLGFEQRNVAVGGQGLVIPFDNVALRADAGPMQFRAAAQNTPSGNATMNDPDASDNTAEAAIDVVAAQGPITADLSISSFDFIPHFVSVGQATRATIAVLNVGPANSQSYRVNLFRRLGNDASWEAAGEQSGGPININQTQNVQIPIANASEGGSNFKAEVTNITDGISEVNGANNRRECGVTVRNAANTGTADLEIVSIDFPPEGLMVGANTIHVVVHNIGPTAAPDGFVFAQGANSQQQALVGGRRLPLGILNSGATQTYYFNFNLADANGGSFSAEAGLSGAASSMIDPTANNHKERLFTAQEVRGALDVVSITIPEGTQTPGPKTLRVRVKNKGSAPTDGHVKLIIRGNGYTDRRNDGEFLALAGRREQDVDFPAEFRNGEQVSVDAIVYPGRNNISNTAGPSDDLTNQWFRFPAAPAEPGPNDRLEIEDIHLVSANNSPPRLADDNQVLIKIHNASSFFSARQLADQLTVWVIWSPQAMGGLVDANAQRWNGRRILFSAEDLAAGARKEYRVTRVPIDRTGNWSASASLHRGQEQIHGDKSEKSVELVISRSVRAAVTVGELANARPDNQIPQFNVRGRAPQGWLIRAEKRNQRIQGGRGHVDMIIMARAPNSVSPQPEDADFLQTVDVTLGLNPALWTIHLLDKDDHELRSFDLDYAAVARQRRE